MVPLGLKSRQWIVDEKGDIIIGEGRMEILKNIQKTGSINKTAKKMKMSYKAVWSKIKATENTMRIKIVQADKKRGSWLTEEGKDLLEKYAVLKDRCQMAEDEIFQTIFKSYLG
ncbi:winged helix-turn-helix domain-containing protein [Thermodesulfobacteriota bacterium]